LIASAFCFVPMSVLLMVSISPGYFLCNAAVLGRVCCKINKKDSAPVAKVIKHIQQWLAVY
jgi:hypothetical protein